MNKRKREKRMLLPLLGFLIFSTLIIGLASLYVGVFAAYLGNDGDAMFLFLFGIACSLSAVSITPHFYRRYVLWMKKKEYKEE